MLKNTFVVGLISVSCALAACQKDQDVIPPPEHANIPANSPTLIANPASKYCLSLKGHLDMTSGICSLPAGEKIDQWVLFKRDHQVEKDVANKANPASEYCVSLQGKLDLKTGICTLPSGEALDEWTLFKRDHGARSAE